jgi:hypothetical protein
MTKRGVPAVVIALIAALGFCGVASAATGPLKVKDARKLARKLAEKQVTGRDVVSFHIVGGKRLSRNSVGFAYDDRTTVNIFCTAAIVVTQRVGSTKTVVSAKFTGQRCKPIPADVLATETATRNAVRALRGSTVATADSLKALEASVKRCRNLAVPRAQRAAASAILDIALVEALEGPNDSALGNFVAELGNVSTSNAALTAGIAGWADYLATVRSLPSIPDPCATLQSWAQAGWAADQSPIDMNAYRAANQRTAADTRAIERAAKYLAANGVFPRTVVQFTPEGLLLRLAPKLQGVTGGKGKLLLKPALS